jgi:hypothetical protein
MSQFTSNIQLEQLGLTENCKVLREFSFYSKRHEVKVTIGEGFITDLGSIPSFAKSAVRASGNAFWRAFVIHDGCYRAGHLTQAVSDDILDEALEVLGLGWYARGKIYYSLRMFGSPTTNEALIANAVRCVTIENLELIRK